MLDILPITYRFDNRDLIYFHSVFYSYSVTNLPEYMHIYTGSRLRRSHLDNLSIVCDVIPRVPQGLNSVNSNIGISKSYFYRAHILCNDLPFEIREN